MKDFVSFIFLFSLQLLPGFVLSDYVTIFTNETNPHSGIKLPEYDPIFIAYKTSELNTQVTLQLHQGNEKATVGQLYDVPGKWRVATITEKAISMPGRNNKTLKFITSLKDRTLNISSRKKDVEWKITLVNDDSSQSQSEQPKCQWTTSPPDFQSTTADGMSCSTDSPGTDATGSQPLQKWLSDTKSITLIAVCIILGLLSVIILIAFISSRKRNSHEGTQGARILNGEISDDVQQDAQVIRMREIPSRPVEERTYQEIQDRAQVPSVSGVASRTSAEEHIYEEVDAEQIPSVSGAAFGFADEHIYDDPEL